MTKSYLLRFASNAFAADLDITSNQYANHLSDFYPDCKLINQWFFNTFGFSFQTISKIWTKREIYLISNALVKSLKAYGLENIGFKKYLDSPVEVKKDLCKSDQLLATFARNLYLDLCICEDLDHFLHNLNINFSIYNDGCEGVQDW